MAAAGFGPYGPEQMQQMLMSMMVAGGGMPAVPPPMPQAAYGGGFPGMPAVDPAMAQLFQQYLQTQNPYLGATGMPPFYGMAPAAAAEGMPPPYGMAPAAAAAQDPTVSVSVEGMKFQYQLTEDDLQKVFKRYGNVKQVKVDEVCSSATVSFQTFQDAQAAIRDLDGKVLNGLDGTLRVAWVSTGVHAASPYAAMGFPQLPQLSQLQGLPQGMSYNPSMAGAAGALGHTLSVPGVASGMGGSDAKPPHVKGQKKFTCRFIIGIENDKEFQVARRMIGAKGANMKRIVKVTEAKLRLRGQGSGYFEGAGQKESSEPLQLCVSCTSQEGYKMAVRQVEDLLTEVHQEYRQWCRENGRPSPDLRINLSESQLVYSSARGSGGPVEADAGSPRRRGGQRGGRNKQGRGGETGGEAEPSLGDRGDAGPNAPSADEIEQLIQDRNEARRQCNFAEADRIRDYLHSRGVGLMDEPGGRGKGNEVTSWRYWRE